MGSSTPSNNTESTPSKPHLHSLSGVRIVGKIRPFLDSEIVQSTDGESSSSSNRPHISLTRIDGEHASIAFGDQSTGRKETYKLDWCYQQEEHVDEIFSREVKPLLQGIIHGCNACVIAYGAGGSGKTQIIQGSQEKPGLAPLAVSEILSLAEEMGSSVTMSCYEVYQDHVYDLLEPKEHEVHVLEDAGRRIQLKGLSQVPVKSIADFKKFYFYGWCNLRNPSQKGLNEATYKSHRGLIVYISHVDKEFKNSLVGKMNFVDLAGYVDTKQKKPHLSENKSLYALLNVAYALNSKETYVPYRESKLTRLLQDFIRSASRALLISCLSPTSCQDTIRAASLASRSCQVVNQHRYDSAKKSNNCPRLVPSCPTSQALNTPVKRHVISQFGSTERKTNVTSSMTKRRHQPLGTSVKKDGATQVGSIAKKADDTLSMTKGRKLLHGSSVKKDGASHVGSIAKKADDTPSMTKGRELLLVTSPITISVQDSISPDGATASNTVMKDSISSDIATTANTFVKDDCPSNEHSNLTSTDTGPQIGAELFMDMPESIIEKKDQNFAINIGDSSPPISETLREISNSLKLLSCQPLSINTPNKDASSVEEICMDPMDPKTPGVPFHLRLDNSKNDNTRTPQSIFKTRSTGLKKSLVHECLAFVNSANKEELKGLKGIGEKRAAYILQLREANPEPFKELDDLKDLGLSSKQIKGLMTNILGEF